MIITRAAILFIMVFGIGAVAATNLQQAYAPRTCPGCAGFKQVFHEFVRDVVKIFYNNGVTDVREFQQLSAQFERDMIQAIIDDHIFLGDPLIPNLMNKYEQKVVNLINAEGTFENPPNAHEIIVELVVDLKKDVLCIFFRDCGPRQY